MIKYTYTPEQLEELFFEDENEDLVLYEKGQWEDDGKYQHCYVVYQDKHEPRYYRMWATRSGSHYTDWEYTFFNSELKEVVLEKIVTTVWKAVQE